MNKKHFYAAVILLLFLAIGIQPALATKYIRDNETGGDATSIGEWNGGTKTCTLNQDVYETIEIMDDGITLDGGGLYNVIGPGSNAEPPVYYGIDLYQRSGITVKNLTVTGFVSGISLRSCSSGICNVTGNTVSNNQYGIWLADSSNVIVENNNVHSNLNDGISIVTAMGNGNNNTLSNNTVSNNNYGITLGGNTDENEIYNNTVSNNVTVGIYLCLNAEFNIIYNNNFENTTNAEVIGVGNVFDLGDPAEEGGKGGNYWSNWTTPDVDGDGIVDNPYVMPPYNEGQDNFPWVAPDGWLTPPTPQALIVQLIDTVAVMNLQQGIDNSLDAKLDAAFNALDDVNQNNDVAAINSLNAFINAVEAQRDTKLTGAQADELIAKANGIIAMLGG